MTIRPPDHITCHHTGHKKKCCDLYQNCCKWIQIMGVDSNTGQEVNEFRCADAWIASLMIENSKEQRQTAAAVESLRNVIQTGASQILALASGGVQKRLDGGG